MEHPLTEMSEDLRKALNKVLIPVLMEHPLTAYSCW